MVKIQRRISEGLNVLQYFTTKEWIVNSCVLKSLQTSMTEHDQKIFPITPEGFKLRPYLTDCVLGARQYLMKENPKTIPRQRIVLKV